MSCEAVILLASPNSVDSKECQREMNLAEDLGKEIIVAILRGVAKDDARLARYADRQFVDLSQQPTERMEPFEHDGRLHRVEFHGPALAAIKARLAHLGIAPGSFAWTHREDGKVKKRTLANITHWPDRKIEALRPARYSTARTRRPPPRTRLASQAVRCVQPP